MKNKFLLNALVISSVSLSFAASAGEKIVGGERVKDLSEVPYMVSLSGVCGGSIINKNWVLTAAHCVGYFSKAKVGVLNLREAGVEFKVKRVIRHPAYNRRTFSNDVALVELDGEIDFAATGLSAVKLATPEFENDGNQDPGIDTTVYGFGNIGQGQSNYTKDLNKVVVPIVSHEEANSDVSYKGQVDETMLPAGYATGGKDSCQGDSGGPLVVFDHQNAPVQVGIVSWGEGCAKAHKYGVYSKVSSAFAWIMQTIGEK